MPETTVAVSLSSTDEIDPALQRNVDSPRPVELKPLSIGDVNVGVPVVQAALSGYSDAPMRVVARRLGAPYTLAEVMIERFVLSLKNRGRTRHHLYVSDEEHPVGGQLMGSKADEFAPAALKLVEAGFDVIDINFGCPVKSAVGGCRGGYHLGHPDSALDIIGRVRDAVPSRIPVTVKMRRGVDNSEKSRENFFEILDGAFARGVAAITVHGRTVEQKYVGPSNWDFLREVKRHAGNRTILGSGDLFTASDCLNMLIETGVDGVSVARGAIGNPWIFSQVQALAKRQQAPIPDLVEQKRVLEMHWNLIESIGDAPRVHATMRMFGIKFARLHPEAEIVRNAFAISKTAEQWQRVLKEHYAIG